ncbi:hypothetical protein BX600DRAFT_442083 [Xylariales sp. PMI_506]|nr:hypothetical protein BX600DRAFT_442083 [Xylariales sp. PMI_506]
MISQTLVTGLAFASGALAMRVAPADYPLARRDCNPTAGNTTYTVQANDTIFTIAAALGSGVCDIARASRLIDATYLVEGWELIVPTATTGCVAADEDTSCLLTNLAPTATCVTGGPHVYTAVPGDTYEYVAEYKLNITTESLLGNLGANTNTTDVTGNTTLTEGQGVKLPLCSPSQCTIQPMHMVNQTFADLAREYGVTVGQIMALNYGYTHSSEDADGSPVLTVPVSCELLSDTITVIS